MAKACRILYTTTSLFAYVLRGVILSPELVEGRRIPWRQCLQGILPASLSLRRGGRFTQNDIHAQLFKTLCIVAIFALSLLARGLFFAEIHSSLPFNILDLDAREYYLWAKNIAGGHIISDGVFFTSPLYAYFLAAIFRVFGGGIETVRVVQMLLGSLVPVFLFYITKRFFGQAAAIAAGVIAAIYGPFIFYDALILKTSLEIFLISLGFLLLLVSRDRDKRPLWLLSGIVWGLAAATKENNFLFIPFIFLWLAIEFNFKKALLSFAIFIAGLAVPILPITANNAIAGSDFVLVGYAGGANFYQGNFRGSDGINRQPDFSRADPRYEEKDWSDEAQRIAGQRLKPSQISKFWFRKGLSEIASDPFFFLENTIRKLGLALNKAEPADDYPPDFYYQFSRLFKFAFLRAWPVLSLGLFGLFLICFNSCHPRAPKSGIQSVSNQTGFPPESRGNDNLPFLLITFVLTYLISLVAFHVSSRYRLPLIWALIPFAAYGLMQGIDIIRSDRSKNTRIIIVVFIACIIIPVIPLHSFTAADVSDSFNTMGQIELDGKYDDAASFYREALKIAPANSQARINLIEVMIASGKTDEAYETAREAAVLFPGIDRYYILLGIADRAKNKSPAETMPIMKQVYTREGISKEGISDDAGADFRYLLRRGRNDLDDKNYSSAIEALESAAKLKPDSATVAFLLAQGYEQRGDMLKAKQNYTRTIEIEPLFLAARYNLAMSELRRGKNKEALPWLKSIKTVADGYAETEKHIGYILKNR